MEDLGKILFEIGLRNNWKNDTPIYLLLFGNNTKSLLGRNDKQNIFNFG